MRTLARIAALGLLAVALAACGSYRRGAASDASWSPGYHGGYYGHGGGYGHRGYFGYSPYYGGGYYGGYYGGGHYRGGH